MAIRVFIIDKLSHIRENIKEVLKSSSEIEVLGTAQAYTPKIKGLQLSEVLLIEHDREIPEALKLVYSIHAKYPGLKVILMSDRDEGPVFMNQMLDAGISGYITKNAGPDEIMYGIKKVAEDGLYICTSFILKFLETLPAPLSEEHRNLSIKISRGEREVLNLVAEGLTNKEIATKLFVSVRTVETRRKNLLEKTNTKNTATLIKFCLKAGLIS